MKRINGLARLAAVAAVTAVVVAAPFGAGAAVRKEGAWPASERRVTFEFDGKPSDGLELLAKEAEWSLVLSKGLAEGEPDVHVAVEDQPADAVLEALFARTNVVARRTGTLVTIVRDDGSAAPPDAAPVATPSAAAAAAPPVPTVRGEDREVFGADLTIDAGEIVHTVSVTGGSVTVAGTVTGDLVVTGGSAVVESGGRVVGNATAIGGSLRLEPGARVDGHAGVVGGTLDRRPGALIGGKAEEGLGLGVRGDSEEDSADGATGGGLAAAARALAQRVTKLALLFVLGCVLLALAGEPMDRLRAEVATRPMRSFALGVVGSLAAIVATVVLSVTIIGIPVALVGVLVFALASYAAVAAVLTTLGAALVGHRTDNVYLHLLLGCACLFVVGAIPYVGALVTFALGMISVGTLVSTRLGGLLERRRPRPLV